MAAKKADATAGSPVQDELEQVIGKDMPKGNPEDQKFLKALLIAVIGRGEDGAGAKLSEKQWDDLSDATRDWATEAATALNSKKTLPALPMVAEESAEADEEGESEEVETKPKRKAKAAKAAAAEAGDVLKQALEEEETEEQEDEAVVASSSEDSAEEETDETQGKESEVATTKTKRGTKAAKTAKKAKPADKPQKRAEAKEAKNGRANGHAAKKAGVDIVFELVIRNPKSGLETVIEKAKAAGADTSDAQIGTLYRLAHKYHAKEVELGKIEG